MHLTAEHATTPSPPLPSTNPAEKALRRNEAIEMAKLYPPTLTAMATEMTQEAVAKWQGSSCFTPQPSLLRLRGALCKSHRQPVPKIK